MYNEHDRPSTTRMVVTSAAIVAGIAALIALAAVVFGMTTSSLSGSAAASKTSAETSIQPPASATANIEAAQPAPTARTTTDAVSTAVTTPASKTPAVSPTSQSQSSPSAAASTGNSGLGVVVIDAGHQGTLDTGMEPNHPGSSSPTKMKVAGGATGVTTHVEESERNLQIALRLEKVLQARGITVVMVRTTQNVDISNKRRAEIANENHAALFIRLHCDSAASNVQGVLTLRPGKDWDPSHPIVARSSAAASLVQAATLKATGAKDRGITPRDDETGFNWAQVPSVLVEMGLMSSPGPNGEDVRLGKADYQDKLADGMANGVVEFLKSGK